MIETERLLLRPLHAGDRDFMSEMMKDPAVYRYILKQEPWTGNRITSLLASQQELLEQHGFCLFGVEVKETRSLSGYCGLQPLEDFSESFQGLIGASWAYHKNYWGQGLATESSAAVLEYSFKNTQLIEAKALIHPANRGSMRVAAKVGFEFEDIVFRNNRLRLMFSVPESAYKPALVSKGSCFQNDFVRYSPV